MGDSLLGNLLLRSGSEMVAKPPRNLAAPFEQWGECSSGSWGPLQARAVIPQFLKLPHLERRPRDSFGHLEPCQMNVPSLPFSSTSHDLSPFLSPLWFLRSWKKWVALFPSMLSGLKFPECQSACVKVGCISNAVGVPGTHASQTPARISQNSPS